MDRCDKIAAGVLVIITMGLMFVLGALSQTIHTRHIIHKMGLVIIELENKNALLIEDIDKSKQWCDEQIEKIAC